MLNHMSNKNIRMTKRIEAIMEMAKSFWFCEMISRKVFPVLTFKYTKIAPKPTRLPNKIKLWIISFGFGPVVSMIVYLRLLSIPVSAA